MCCATERSRVSPAWPDPYGRGAAHLSRSSRIRATHGCDCCVEYIYSRLLRYVLPAELYRLFNSRPSARQHRHPSATMKNILDVAVVLPLFVVSAAAQSLICRTTMGTVSLRRVPRSTTTSYFGQRPTQVLVTQRTITSYQGIVSTSVVTSESTTTMEDPTRTIHDAASKRL